MPGAHCTPVLAEGQVMCRAAHPGPRQSLGRTGQGRPGPLTGASALAVRVGPGAGAVGASPRGCNRTLDWAASNC